MQKRGKPNLFLGVILPIILVEIFFIVITILSLFRLAVTEQIAYIIIIIVSGIILLITFVTSILIYILRYSSYENSLYPKGNFSTPCLVGFIMAAASYLISGIMSLIPLIGTIFAFIFGMVIIAGGIVSFVGMSTMKKGEKGRGMANIGGFLGIYYAVHLLTMIILLILLVMVVASVVSPVV